MGKQFQPKTPTEKKKIKMTLANKITLLRIILIPVIVICLTEHQMKWFYMLFGFSILTDLLDGLAARIRGEKTVLGAFLDPMADKILLTSVYLTMTALHTIDVWVFVVIFSRDLLIVLGWGVIYILTSSFTITPRLLGKTTTAFQMASVLIFNLPDVDHSIKIVFMYGIVLLTIASIIDYILLGEKHLSTWD